MKNARFARPVHLADLRKADYGVYLGRHPAVPALSGVPGLRGRYLLSASDTHTLVVAPTRAGKGVGALIPTALSWPHSLVCLDPKGEFRSLTATWRARYQSIFTWGPTVYTARWNPLAEIRALAPTEWPEAARKLTTAFIRAVQDKPDFWSREGESFLAGAFVWGASVNASIGHVYKLLSDREQLDALLASIPASDPLYRWAADYRGRSDREASGVRSTALSLLRSFDSVAVRSATSEAELTYAQMLANATTYLHCTASDFATHGGLVTAFLEGLTSFILGSDGPLAQPLLLLLDEFSLLAHLPSLRTLLTLSAGFHLRLVIVLQDLAQIPPDIRAIVLSNCHDQLFFAARDIDTTEYLSRRIGTEMIRTVTRSRGRSGGSRSQSERKESLLQPHEIRDLKHGLLFHGNAPPAKIELYPYYKDSRFAARVRKTINATPNHRDVSPLAPFLPSAQEAPPVESTSRDAAPTPAVDPQQRIAAAIEALKEADALVSDHVDGDTDADADAVEAQPRGAS